MRGVTLVKLLDKLRVELRVSQNPAHNNSARDRQVLWLQSTQEWLWEDYTWPHLRAERNYKVEAGQRLYDFGSDFDIDRIERVEIKTDGRWAKLDPGIDSCHFAAHDSELGQRAWPPRRWRIYENEQVEVWPIADRDGEAATLDGYLKVTGIRKLRPLVDDGDRCDLDDQLIYLYAAAKALGNSPEGKIVLNTANRRFARMKSNLTPRREFKMFGIGRSEPPRRPFISSYRPPS